MTPSDYQRAGTLFEQLRALRPSEQAAALDAACAGDTGLRAVVWRLLEADRDASGGSFLETRAMEAASRLLSKPQLPVPGTVIGNYRLVSQIGAGGMGVVYEGRDLHLDRRVAVKILPPPFSGSGEEMVKRFQREARAASRLNHPNILTIFEAGFDRGYYYIATEYVEGKTLRQIRSEGPVELWAVFSIAIQLCSAVGAAHEAGIVHRDIKPENIMIRPDEIVKVLDFGLAKMEHPVERDVVTSQTGTVLGTAAYMSPEQASGKPADARSDIFSLGAVLHELLTGRRLAESDKTTVRSLRPLESVAALERIAARCLAWDPIDRYQNASEVRAALEAANHAGSASRPASIAVLPFVNLTGDKDNGYFSDGLAEEILNLLTRIQGLKVIARTSSFAFRGKEQDVRKIAEVLCVRTVLEGSVRKAGSRVRVTAKLINAEDATHLWAERYDREMVDMFALQNEMAAAVASALQLTFSARARRTPNLAAYEAYLKGLGFLYAQTPEGLARGRESFERAVAVNPDYPEALWALGAYYVSLSHNDLLPAHEAIPRARAAFLKALEIDEALPIAHAHLGTLACVYEYDWEEGKRRFELVARSDAVPAEVHMSVAYWFCLLGQIEAAIDELRRALEKDPLNVFCRQTFAFYHWVAGKTERALEELRRTVEIDRNYWLAHMLTGRINFVAGETAKAVASMERAYELSPWNARTIGLLAGLMVRTGNHDRAEQLRGELSALPAHRIPLGMLLYSVLCSDMDGAAAWFEESVQHRSLALFAHIRDPILQPLRGSAHWPRLARSVHLTT